MYNLAPGGIEPTTFALLARRSNQLSYGAYMNDQETLWISKKMNLNAIQDREICCYSISCKEKDNIDITLQWLISHSKSGGGQN